jgi:uncharacterized membrane protein YkoI
LFSTGRNGPPNSRELEMQENKTRIRTWTQRAAVGIGGLAIGAVVATAAGAYAAGATADSATADSAAPAASGAPAPQGAPGGPRDESKSQRPDEKLLTGDAAAKVRAAALAKYPGATIQRVETDSDGVYEAHLTTSDGKRVTVEIGKDYAVTGEEAGRGGPRG